MISTYMFTRIRELKDKGLNCSQIGIELGIDRKTVRKYLKTNAPPNYSARKKKTRKNPLEGFETQLKIYFEKNIGLSAREIFELLVQSGYKGSERTVNRTIARLKGEKPKERFFQQQYEPGEQSQFDFKESVDLPFIDGIKKIHLHFGTLPCSSRCFIRAYPFKTYECYMDGVHRFFEKMGGLTINIRIDNLSPCVRKVLKGNKRIYTISFERAIKYYGFNVLPCSPGKGNEKGDVERDIRTFATRIKNLVANENLIFKDFKELNSWLEQYMENRQTEAQKQKYEQERIFLKPLPPWEEDIICKTHIGPSSAYGTVRIDNSTYSVPDHMIGVGCRIVEGPYDVKIYKLGSNIVVVHPKKIDGEHSVLLEHVLSSLTRKPQAMVRWQHRNILFPSPIFQKFYDRLKFIDSQSAEREFLRSVNLVQHCPLSEIGAGMELVLEADTKELFQGLRDLLFTERRPNNVIDLIQKLQVPLSPKLDGYDELIPKKGNL